MGTTGREHYLLRRIFTGRRGRTGPRTGARLCRPWDPSSGQTDFRVGDRQAEKRTLPGAPAAVSAFRCVAAQSPHPGAGMLTGFPFGGRRPRARVDAELPCPLGSPHPCPTAVHMEPFPTSVLTVLAWVFATTCTPVPSACVDAGGGEGGARGHLPPRSAPAAVRPGVTPEASSRAAAPAYSPRRRACRGGGVWVARLSAIHFQG